MVQVSLILCSVLVFVAIASKFAVSSGTDISYQIGELNNKLTYLQGRLNLFDYITDGNVSVLLHRVEVKDLKCVENVTVHMNGTNVKLHNLEHKINALASHVTKQDDLQSKFAENVKLEVQETNRKLANLVDRVGSFDSIDTRLNALESKLNALATTVTNFIGDIKDALLKPLSSCVDAFARPLLNRGSGVYNIQLNDNSSPFNVYCMADPNGGQPWTVVQRRVDGSVNFYRNWTEYHRGFGDLEGNFFIGLEKLHSLTTKGEQQELWVMLTDPDGISGHAYYDSFAIGSETEKYPLAELGKYSGDAADALTYHKSMKFSTYDSDNDLGGGNCAKEFKSAWWFNSCYICHLNGIYGTNGVYCGCGFRESSVPLKYTHMAIRPARK